MRTIRTYMADGWADERIVYILNENDAQRVAREILNRGLTHYELEKIHDGLSAQIDWKGAIRKVINERVEHIDGESFDDKRDM